MTLNVDLKDIVIEDLKRTLGKLERSLRSAGSPPKQFWHTARDVGLAGEFLKMADEARESLDFARTMGE